MFAKNKGKHIYIQ